VVQTPNGNRRRNRRHLRSVPSDMNVQVSVPSIPDTPPSEIVRANLPTACSSPMREQSLAAQPPPAALVATRCGRVVKPPQRYADQ
jgi:hypothetical protein